MFFFGGGWVNGNPGQFFPHCAYLASRGMVHSQPIPCPPPSHSSHHDGVVGHTPILALVHMRVTHLLQLVGNTVSDQLMSDRWSPLPNQRSL